jgi:hypothetical protein
MVLSGGKHMGKKRRTSNRFEIKAFRHQVSVLKSKGLISKRVDARKQKPTRYMKSKIAKLKPILDGTAAGVKVRPDLLRQYREAGFNTLMGRVIVEKRPEEMAAIRKGHAVLSSPLGPVHIQERLILPFSPRNVLDFETRLRKNPEHFNRLKASGDVFAFKIFGNNSLATFEDAESLLEYLNRYQVIHDARYSGDAWESLQFFRVAPGKWKHSPKRTRTYTDQDRRSVARRRYSLVKGERIHKLEEAERKRKKRAEDMTYAARERERDRMRKAQMRAANPENNKAQRQKESLRKRNLRKQAKLDERNGH